LDAELRLVTPTDPESGSVADREDEGLAGPAAVPGERYYLLAHDYLVPALRQWLTRKQRETRRGRMQLLLAERAALWGAKQERKQLPGWWEWASIRLHTRPRDWTALERRMMSAAARRHLLQAGLQAGVLLLFLGVVGWGVFEVYRGPLRAATLVRELRSAPPADVHHILNQLDSCRYWANPLLEEMTQESRRYSKVELRARLALLSVDPEGQEDYLFKGMLNPDTDPDEYVLIRDELWVHSRELLRRLWDVWKDETDKDRHFRAAFALARYDTDNVNSERVGAEVAEKLVKQNQHQLAKWQDISVAPSMLIPLSKHLHNILRDRNRRESERVNAARFYLKTDPGHAAQKLLIDLLLDTEGADYKYFLEWFTAAPKVAAKLLLGPRADPGIIWPLLGPRADPRVLRPDASEDDTKRRAHAAVVLLQLDQWEKQIQAGSIIWPLLGPRLAPRVRSYLIHRLSRVDLKPETLIQQYGQEEDPCAKRALLLSLGEFAEFQLPARRPKELVKELLETYQDHSDPGLHAAVDWLLRQWKVEEEWLKQANDKWANNKEQREKRLDSIRQLVNRDKEKTPPQWYVNSQGQTMVVIAGPVEFGMGSPDDEPTRPSDEALHRKRIPRSFALATKEVTVQQFQEFLKDHPDIGSRWKGSLEKSAPDEPIVGVTWFEAAQYCRWLSKREGISENKMCYPPIAQIKEGMSMPADYLWRTGYRLPTEAEWEYVCRAGASTSRHYGVAEELLGDYAWYAQYALGRARPVGSKKPNDFGLFDMLGNALEWCQDAYAPYPPDPPIEDREDKRPITALDKRVLRGGSFASGAEAVRSAARFSRPPQFRSPLAGLRVARTLPPD
jgi:formylglycine-generating enzyme required for sulfatase activity